MVFRLLTTREKIIVKQVYWSQATHMYLHCVHQSLDRLGQNTCRTAQLFSKWLLGVREASTCHLQRDQQVLFSTLLSMLEISWL